MEWVSAIFAGIGLFVFFAIMALAVLSIIVGLPGCWVIFGEALAFALITRFDKGLGWWDLLALAVMAGAADVLEFLITAYGAKKSGASNRALLAAMAGAVIGAILVNMVLWIVGAVIGAFVGLFAGAWLYTYLKEGDRDAAWRAGVGTIKGWAGAVFVKGAMAVAMAAVIISRIIPAL